MGAPQKWQYNGHAAAAPAGGQSGRRKRIRHWTADDRAAHRAFERSRREAFKERLTRLAGEIPSLQSTDPNRLSKHVVLDESVSLHRTQKDQIAASLRQVDALLAERDDLLAEVNRWRLGAGVDTRQPMSQQPDHRQGQPPAEPERPSSLDAGDLQNSSGFGDGSPQLNRGQPDPMAMSLAAMGPPNPGSVPGPGPEMMAQDGPPAEWDNLPMGLPMSEGPLDLDGLDVGGLVPGAYDLPQLRHGTSQEFGVPFQPHQQQMLDPSAFLHDGHVHTA